MFSNKRASRSYTMDMCNGPLLMKLVSFAVPLVLSGILQLLFNAADTIIVGKFAGHSSMAAVGSTSSLINLMINVFVGLSIGANVLVARYYGSRSMKNMEETIHTAMLLALVSGLVLIVIGISLAGPILTLMGSPPEVLPLAILYIRIYFAGMPVMLIYNFGSAILRASGDTRRPLYFLLTAGIINVILNLIFVVVFSMGVAGVALATVISQCVSAGLVVQCLMRAEDGYRLQLKRLRFVPVQLKAIVKIGIPAGIQGALFSASNVLIQASINSFGALAVAGSAASASLEGFVYTSMNAIYQTCLNFTSQNFGALKFKRMTKTLLYCQGIVLMVGVVMGGATVLFGRQLLGIYSSEQEVVSFGLQRLVIICSFYAICGMMDTMVGSLRGMGYSVVPMLVSLTGACVLRIVWIYTVFAKTPTLDVLYVSYPISWTITLTAHILCYLIIRKQVMKRHGAV